MKINKKLLAILSLILVGASISACSSGEDQSQQTQGSQEEANQDRISFTTETINKEEFSGKDLQNYDLTLINIMATWCQPCVEEMPELEKVYNEYKDKKVNVVGYVIDTKKKGNIKEDALNSALDLQNKLNLTYPMLIPDDDNLNGIAKSIQAVPTTIFVDKEGRIVGEPISGSNSSDGWKVTIDQRLKMINE
ncbi:MAG: TlpA disulfide reductase family protein [Finegoldia sp.]|nr:TlpA disulfide reductase family protein [Finegoldia sp.]